MKIHKCLLLALIVSAVLSVSAYADKHQGNNNDTPAVSRPSRGESNSSSSHTGSGYRYSGRPTFAPSQRFSSPSMRPTYSGPIRADSFRQRSFNPGGSGALSQRQFTPRNNSSGDRLARFENSPGFRALQSDRLARIQTDRLNRRTDLRTQRGDRLTQFENRRAQDFGTTRNIRENRAGLTTTTDSRRRAGSTSTGDARFSTAGTNNHVFARRSADWQRNWDRNRDHWWHGHRCRFVNDSWIIFDIGFSPWYGYPYDYYASDYSYYPYGYDPYGYGSYGYDPYSYDSGYSGGGYYGGAGDYSSSDQYDGSTVAAAQEQLARQGYYRGAIDGILGPETRRAIRRYQSDNGLRVTGYLTGDTLELLGLGRVAAD